MQLQERWLRLPYCTPAGVCTKGVSHAYLRTLIASSTLHTGRLPTPCVMNEAGTLKPPINGSTSILTATRDTWYQKPLMPASTARPWGVLQPADNPPGLGAASMRVTL